MEDLCRGLHSTAETPRKRSKVKLNGAEELDSAIDGVKSWQFFLRLLSRMSLSLPDRPLGDTVRLKVTNKICSYVNNND